MYEASGGYDVYALIGDRLYELPADIIDNVYGGDYYSKLLEG